MTEMGAFSDRGTQSARGATHRVFGKPPGIRLVGARNNNARTSTKGGNNKKQLRSGPKGRLGGEGIRMEGRSLQGNRWLTVVEVALMLRWDVDSRAARRRLRRIPPAQLPYHPLGRDRLYTEADVVKYVESRRVQ